MKRISFLTALFILLPTNAFANITVNEVKIGTNGAAQEEEVLPIATEVILNSREGRIIASIPHADSVGSFRVPLVSRITTKVKIRFNDSNIGFVGDKDETYKLKANQAANFVFTVYEATKGNIEILNENNKVILSVPYLVTFDNGRSQGINFSANKTIGGDGDNSVRLNTGFRVTQQHNNSSKGVSSFGINTSTSTDFDQINININYNYKWE